MVCFLSIFLLLVFFAALILFGTNNTESFGAGTATAFAPASVLRTDIIFEEGYPYRRGCYPRPTPLNHYDVYRWQTGQFIQPS